MENLIPPYHSIYCGCLGCFEKLMSEYPYEEEVFLDPEDAFVYDAAYDFEVRECDFPPGLHCSPERGPRSKIKYGCWCRCCRIRPRRGHGRHETLRDHRRGCMKGTPEPERDFMSYIEYLDWRGAYSKELEAIFEYENWLFDRHGRREDSPHVR